MLSPFRFWILSPPAIFGYLDIVSRFGYCLKICIFWYCHLELAVENYLSHPVKHLCWSPPPDQTSHFTFLKIWSNITLHIFSNKDDFRQHFPDQNLSHSICSHLEVHQQRSTLTSTSTMKNKNKHILKGNLTSYNIWQHLFTPWLGWGGKGVQQVQVQVHV